MKAGPEPLIVAAGIWLVVPDSWGAAECGKQDHVISQAKQIGHSRASGGGLWVAGRETAIGFPLGEEGSVSRCLGSVQ